MHRTLHPTFAGVKPLAQAGSELQHSPLASLGHGCFDSFSDSRVHFALLRGRRFAVSFYRPLNPGTSIRQILQVHRWPHREPRVEGEKPGFSYRG